ncbi:MAG: sigma-54-dependent Fis family transcriptional regulator [Kofleriaceae bacterium]|nr:sigma-54-dependent Fis family transcriptional regulator [Kofleriaceae bacterium]
MEDDKGISALTKHHLTASGYEVFTAFDGASALAMYQSVQPNAVCLDLGLPDMSGMELFEQLRRLDHAVPILVLTADDQVATAVHAMRAGAYDYLVKPVERVKLLSSLAAAVRMQRQAESSATSSPVPGRHPNLIGDSPLMRMLFQQIERVGESNISVLLHGESGTGKELVANAIHNQSPRRTGPFVAINCAAIPEALQEAQLFGHERGAFTGATQRHIGRFEQADGGTLFLDEVAELRLDLQAKLLRALQERVFHRVGGQTEVRSDFRVIAASHKDLLHAVTTGHFREDLYFRLAVFEVEVPALRSRGDDIILLANHFCNYYAAEARKAASISPAALEVLQRYDWPGNVRELQSAIHRAIILSNTAQILPADLPPRLTRAPIMSGATVLAVPATASSISAAGSSAASSAFTGERNGAGNANMSCPNSDVPDGDLEAVEKRTIIAVVGRTGGNMTLAARELGIGRTTLYRKLKKYGLAY